MKSLIHTCFKCGKEIKEGEEWVFSSEWDAFCHKKCCPAYNKDIEPDEECKVCEVYIRREKLANLVTKVLQISEALNEALSACHELEDYIRKNFDKGADEDIYDTVLAPILNTVQVNIERAQSAINNIFQRTAQVEE